MHLEVTQEREKWQSRMWTLVELVRDQSVHSVALLTDKLTVHAILIETS